MRDTHFQIRRWPRGTALQGLLAVFALVQSQPARGESPDPVERAIRYLAVEVPRWHRENACYSCHNNGDAVRSLAIAARRGHLRDRAPLAETIAFLRAPAKWDANGPDGPFKDVNLARIQFGCALGELTASGLVTDRGPLRLAASRLAELQAPDGSWPSDADGSIGSPVTYGQPLATALSLRTLQAAGVHDFAKPLRRGREWFAAREPRNTLEASATLLALGDSVEPVHRSRCNQARELIARGESASGGWGPFENSPADVFDTALVLIALATQSATQPSPDESRLQIARGRKYLLERQNSDGSWPATTRPPGIDSYAQQVSTTSWALEALLVTAGTERSSSTPGPAEKCD